MHRPRHPLGPCGRDVRRGSVSYRRNGLRHRQGLSGGAKAGEPLAKDAILACAKHFAGYSETQGGRDASEADLSHRKLESWFLPPFERVAKEGCGTFMLGYESIDGVPVTFNKWLLSDKLRGDWHYQAR